MTSLGDVYEGGVGGVTTRRRLYAGAGLLAIGTVLAVAGLVVATTAVGGGPQTITVRLTAGILFGLAAPSVLAGVIVALPAKPHLRVAAAIGVSLTLLGVGTFSHAYPHHWAGYGQDFTTQVSAIYALGILMLMYCLFAGIATLRRRNDPGGTISLVNPIKVVSTGSSDSGGTTQSSTHTGGVGVAGSMSSDVMTAQTGASPTSDGGVTQQDLTTPSPDTSTATQSSDPNASRVDPSLTDQYCGNCRYFEYENDVAGMIPYCHYHNERLDDMTACDHWEPNDKR